MRARILGLVAALTLLNAACGPRLRPPVPPGASIDRRVETLIGHGCYQCLQEALALAARAGTRAQVFEAAALLAVRAKELGLPFREWRDRAAQAAAPDGSTDLALAIVDAIPVDPLTDREAALVTRTAGRASWTGWRQQLRTASWSAPFRTYLDLSLVCLFQPSPEREATLAAAADLDLPLLRYRRGACGGAGDEELLALRNADEAYVDADYALARHALEEATAAGQDEGLRRLRAAATAFPASPAIHVLLGQVHQAREDWAEALSAFDAALARAPGNADAAIGRTISLSQLSRRPEAIASATSLIDAGQWFLGEAHYWRGWNLLQLGQLPEARADADRARTLMANAAVLVLSGLVDWRLRRLESAEGEFDRALAIDQGQCEAAQYLGAVRAERARLVEAAPALAQARQCYDLSITLRREAIAKLLGDSGEAATAGDAVRRQERAIADIEARRQDVLQALLAVERARGIRPAAP